MLQRFRRLSLLWFKDDLDKYFQVTSSLQSAPGAGLHADGSKAVVPAVEKLPATRVGTIRRERYIQNGKCHDSRFQMGLGEYQTGTSQKS